MNTQRARRQGTHGYGIETGVSNFAHLLPFPYFDISLIRRNCAKFIICLVPDIRRNICIVKLVFTYLMPKMLQATIHVTMLSFPHHGSFPAIPNPATGKPIALTD